MDQYLFEVLARFFQIAAPIVEYPSDHQVAELPHDILDGAMLEIAIVAFRANELVLSGQRNELADDEVGECWPPLNTMERTGRFLAAFCTRLKSLVWKDTTIIMPKQFIKNA